MLNIVSETEMHKYLLDEFCTDSYEVEQMKKWIKIKGVEGVYKIVTSFNDI